MILAKNNSITKIIFIFVKDERVFSSQLTVKKVIPFI